MKDIEFYNYGFCSYHGRNKERPVIRDEINSFIYSHILLPMFMERRN